jgi:hypothetical protein
MEARETPDHLPQRLLRKRTFQVVGPQARLHVRDRHVVVERGDRSLECAFGVALYDRRGPAATRQYLLELLAAPDAELGERAPVSLQDDVGRDLEAVENLLRHLAVLAGVQPLHVGGPLGAHRVIERCQLYDLWPCPGNEEDMFHWCRPVWSLGADVCKHTTAGASSVESAGRCQS